MKLYRILITLLLLSCAAWAEPPKNVVLMIADGAGYNHFEAASLYRHGAPGALKFQRFPVRCAVSTCSAEGNGYDPQQAWQAGNYLARGATDSAAAATALATGVKTLNRAIGLDAKGNRLVSVVGRAEAQGKSTGVVTTVPFSHATPAGFVAHSANRNNYEAIAREMIAKSPVEVIIGCGNPDYDNDAQPVPEAKRDYRYVGGAELWAQVAAGTASADADGDGAPDPWTRIERREEFQRLRAGPAPKRLLGVPRVYETLQQRRSGNVQADPFAVPFTADLPTLAEMTQAALNVLDGNPKGFFLMVEGGAVDWAAHANQSGRLVEESLAFADAVEAVIAWVEASSSWSDTLLIVTADHETGWLTGPAAPADGQASLLENRGAGHLPGMVWRSKDHTNSLVPLYARGAGAERLTGCCLPAPDPVRGRYLDNTDIVGVMAGR